MQDEKAMAQEHEKETYSKNEFLKRMFIYRLQYICGAIVSVISFVGLMEGLFGINIKNGVAYLLIIFSLYNCVTYLWSKQMAKIYGIEMFADLDQEWLKAYQDFDSKAFGTIFAGLIHCREIAGPYMLGIMVVLAIIDTPWSFIAGVFCFIGYNLYCSTYFETTVSYKVPRIFGGNMVVSRVLEKGTPSNGSNDREL